MSYIGSSGTVQGLLNYRGAYDASTNLFPATGGSGTGGAIKKGDSFVISVEGTLGGIDIQVGDTLISNVDTPGQTASNWNTLNTNISYTPEDSANKVTSVSTSSTDTEYPSAKLTYDQLKIKAPLSSPTFTGKVTTPAIKITTGAGADKALVSDADGDASWSTSALGTAAYADTGDFQAPLTFGIADTNKLQINAADVADNDYAKFTATGLEGRSYSEVLSDIGGAAASHASQHAVSGSDTVFPADPGADKYLMWDDNPGTLVWADAGGAYSRSATKVVAANDSLDKTNVDYVCDGTADDVQIQAAIDAVTATGGTVKLMEGTYNIATTINPKANVILSGNGDGTILSPSGAVDLFTFAAASSIFTISNLQMIGNGKAKLAVNGNSKNFSFFKIDNCLLTSFTTQFPIDILTSTWPIITNNRFVNCVSFGEFTSYADIGNNIFNSAGSAITSSYYILYIDSDYCSIHNNYFDANGNTNSNGTICNGGGSAKISCNTILNGKGGIKVSGAYCEVINNIISAPTDFSILASSNFGHIISGNTVGNGAGTYGIRITASQTLVCNNFIMGTTTGISDDSSTRTENVISNNIFRSNNTDINIVGLKGSVLNNQTEDTYHESKTVIKKNTSGFALSAGDLVCLKAVAAGNEVTTTTTAGDNKVYGMAVEAIANNAYGSIQTLGKTLVMKVDGTDDIAIGDYISCLGVADYVTGTALFTQSDATVAGTDTVWDSTMVGKKIKNDASGKWYVIASVASNTSLELTAVYAEATTLSAAYTISSQTVGQKATAGETAIAIALEAYTTDDCAGVIDALIIPPRLI